MTKNHHIPPPPTSPPLRLRRTATHYPCRQMRRPCAPDLTLDHDTASTQLQNNVNRWYDAQTGRWLSVDTIGYGGKDTNLYRYVVNNSLTRLDYNGLAWYDYVPLVGTVTNAMFPSPGQDVFDYFDDITLLPTKKDCCGNSGGIDQGCYNKILAKLCKHIKNLGVSVVPGSGLEISLGGVLSLLVNNPEMAFHTVIKSANWFFILDGIANTSISARKLFIIVKTSSKAIEKFCRCP